MNNIQLNKKALSINSVIIALMLLLGQNLYYTFNVDYRIFIVFIVSWGISYSLIYFKNYTPSLRRLFCFVFVFGIFKVIYDQTGGSRMLVVNILTPWLIVGLLPPPNSIFRNNKEALFFQKIIKLLIYALILDSVIAIIERLLGVDLFIWGPREQFSDMIAYDDMSVFRSSGLHGHPLQNSLVISTIISFVLVTPFKLKIKLILWGLGFVAVLCFNCRAAIVGNALLFTTFWAYSVFFNKKEKKKKLLFISGIVVAIVGCYLIFSSGLGMRLIEMGLIDEDSSQVRIDVWKIFDQYSFGDFLIGLPYETILRLLFRLHLRATENFYIDWLLGMGGIFLIGYLLLLAVYLKCHMKDYNRFSFLFVNGAFWLLASTNNSLSATFIPLSVFLLCIIVFNPKYVSYFIPSKYLQIT